MKPKTYNALAPIVNSYPLEQPGDRSWFSVIRPIARTNEVTNPSFETNTTSWTAVGGSIARSTTQQYHGAYSLAVTPVAAVNDGVYYGTITTVTAEIRAISCKFRGVANVPYKISIATTGGVDLAAYTFKGNGRWQWVWVYYKETSGTTRRIYVTKNNSASTAVFYIDGVQSEVISAGERVSTYIDGDQQGLLPNQYPAPYYWNGTPHASTSTRSAQTRAGGEVMELSLYKFLLAAITGLAMAVPQNVSVEYARLDGGYDDYARKPSQSFTLAGRIQDRTARGVDDAISDLGAVLDRDHVGTDQRLMLRYQKCAGSTPIGDAAIIPCRYESGLDAAIDNAHAITTPLTFRQYLPIVLAEREQGVALTVQQTVADADYIIQYTPAGGWATIGTGTDGAVHALAIGLDGALYAGGNFTNAGGGGANYIAKWNGAAWSALGVGTDSLVYALAVGPDGTLYVGGFFTNAGGGAASYVAKWNGAAWSALDIGVDSFVQALVVGPDGALYAGGAFHNAGGGAAAHIAKWNGTAWSALGAGVDSTVYALAVGPDGTLYAGGNFTTAGGNAANYVAKWNGTAWSTLGAGTDDSVQALAVGPDGTLYAGGLFHNAGGGATAHIAKWNGTAWSAVGTGVNDIVQALTVGLDGTLYAGGHFTTAGGITVPDGIAQWNGAAWIPLGANLPGAAETYAIQAPINGNLYIGFSTSGSAITEANVTATNDGTARAYPTLIIKGPTSGTSRIYQIRNVTTGRAIYLNYTINAGETATLRFEPDNLSFVSDFQGNIASKIMPGSNEADFFLQPGANTVAFYSADSTVTAVLRWRPGFTALQGLTH